MKKSEILYKNLEKTDVFIRKEDGLINGHYATSAIADAMEEYTTQQVFNFLEFKKTYQRDERQKVLLEQVRVGGVFSWSGASDEKIYKKFLESQEEDFLPRKENI